MTNGIRFQTVGALSVVALIILVVVIILLIPLLFLGLIGAAFTRLGFSWISALAMVLLILLGSAVNIPVYTIKRDMIRIDSGGEGFGDSFVQRSARGVWETVVSINVGGAILPVCVAAYLLYTALPLTGNSIFLPLFAGILIVAVFTGVSTRALPGIGLQVPILMPALVALLVALLLAGGAGIPAAVSAFVSGTIGVLVGGNISQIPKIRDLELPAWSIGGTGTFGSVLICCILPALLA
ncbi:MAG: DUF1614 domain-containing protein [Methanomicrobiales archaeon]|nr:DUF1614 domain-containing protein [Methanomicrobiales archaeon]